jgi:radical SAM superfamily enzyme YgiQ (UPF0313 family)
VKPKLRLVQLPIPQPAALAPTGNVPLAAGCLAVSAEAHGFLSRLDLSVVPPEVTDAYGDTRLADHLAAEEPDFVGFSLYLWNAERSLHLARELKRRSPRTRIIIGGPEVSSDNPFLLGQEGFEIAVTGEAEDTFGALLAALLEGRDPAGLPGVGVRNPLGTTVFGPTPQAGFPLADYPSPYVRGYLPVDPERATYVETVRGCRSHCTFCFYPRSSNVLRTLSVSASRDLVERLGAAGAREIVFLDPTFNHRPELVPLLDALAEVNLARSLSFFGEVRAEGLTADHARRLAAAGFTKLEIGLQSVNRATLQRTRRGGSPEKVAEAAKMLHGEGVRLLVDLIIGLPGDTAEDVARGVEFLLENHLGEDAQVFPLALLPGTAMRADAEREGLSFDPAPPYLLRRSATLDGDAMRRALFDAEEQLGRRLSERPRPHLVSAAALPDPPDVLRVKLDGPVPEALAAAARPAAQHVALWVEARDLYARRGLLREALQARLATDPYATLDVVLAPGEPFPLDLVAEVRRELDGATPSYSSRVLSLRGENAQRRLTVVLGSEARFPRDYLAHLQGEAPVFRDQTLGAALRNAAALGEDEPGARITGEVSEPDARELARRADPDWVAFASRPAEKRWIQEVLGYRELRE